MATFGDYRDQPAASDSAADDFGVRSGSRSPGGESPNPFLMPSGSGIPPIDTRTEAERFRDEMAQMRAQLAAYQQDMWYLKNRPPPRPENPILSVGEDLREQLTDVFSEVTEAIQSQTRAIKNSNRNRVCKAAYVRSILEPFPWYIER